MKKMPAKTYRELCLRLNALGVYDKSLSNVKRRFMQKVRIIPGKCWEWIGSKNHEYGQIRIGSKLRRACRVSYAIWVGDLRVSGHEIDHLVCSNPSCVNPNHIRLVTHLSNLSRNNSPPSINIRKEYCINGHNSWEPKFYRKEGKTYRSCAKCRERRKRGENLFASLEKKAYREFESLMPETHSDGLTLPRAVQWIKAPYKSTVCDYTGV